MREKLKPCPSCSGKGNIQEYPLVGYSSKNCYGVICPSCGFQTMQSYSLRVDAIDAWNSWKRWGDMSEEWNELVTETQAHIKTKDKLAELEAINKELYEALDTQCEYCMGKEVTDGPCADCIVGKALRKARGEEEGAE